MTAPRSAGPAALAGASPGTPAALGPRDGRLIGPALLGMVVVAAVLVVLADPGTARLVTARLPVVGTIFLGIFLEALPFLVLGVLVSGALSVWVSDARLARVIPRGRLAGALVGSLLGLAIPVCECGVIAVSRRLLDRGAPLPLAVAFMLAGPVVNPIVIGATWIAFAGDPTIVVGRIALVFGVAVAVATFVGLHARPNDLLRRSDGRACGCVDHAGEPRKLERALQVALGELLAMGKLLVIGAAIAAMLQAFVPRATFLALAEQPGLAIVALMALATLLSICSSVDAFVALSFASAFGPGPIVAFLAFGPLVNLKSIPMYASVLRPPALLLLLLLCAQLAFLGATFLDLWHG